MKNSEAACGGPDSSKKSNVKKLYSLIFKLIGVNTRVHTSICKKEIGVTLEAVKQRPIFEYI